MGEINISRVLVFVGPGAALPTHVDGADAPASHVVTSTLTLVIPIIGASLSNRSALRASTKRSKFSNFHNSGSSGIKWSEKYVAAAP